MFSKLESVKLCDAMLVSKAVSQAPALKTEFMGIVLLQDTRGSTREVTLEIVDGRVCSCRKASTPHGSQKKV